jgi:hypothetical protein
MITILLRIIVCVPRVKPSDGRGHHRNVSNRAAAWGIGKASFRREQLSGWVSALIR